MASTPPNDDVMTNTLASARTIPLEIENRLQIGRDVIDSPYFKKLHNQQHANNYNNEDDTVYLKFDFPGIGDDKLSIKFLDNGKLLKSHNDNDFNNIFNFCMKPGHLLKLVGPVKGLIGISCRLCNVPISICNPFLGQIKILPISPILSSSFSGSCQTLYREIGIGFDQVTQNYKAVELLSCLKHCRLHARLQSRATNSWRDLAGDNGGFLDEAMYIFKPIKLSCKNGYFAHWHAYRGARENLENIILTFDMKNEVFRTINLPDYP